MDNVRETLTEIRNLPPNVAQKKNVRPSWDTRCLISADYARAAETEQACFVKEDQWGKDQFMEFRSRAHGFGKVADRIFFAQDLTAGHACYTYRYPFIVISNFAVNPRFQGQGVGRKIIEELIKKTYKANLPKTIIALVPQSALHSWSFFDKFGIKTEVVDQKMHQFHLIKHLLKLSPIQSP